MKGYKKLSLDYKTVFPACLSCKKNGSKEIAVERTKRQKAKKEAACTNDKRDDSVVESTSVTESKRAQKRPSCTGVGASSSDVGSTKVTITELPDTKATKFNQQTKIGFQVIKKRCAGVTDLTDEESCVICNRVDDNSKTHNIVWIDCDICSS